MTEEEYNREFARQQAELIRKLRKESGLTQQQVADRGNISVSTVRRFEKDAGNYYILTLFRIGEGMKRKVSDFYDFPLAQQPTPSFKK